MLYTTNRMTQIMAEYTFYWIDDCLRVPSIGLYGLLLKERSPLQDWSVRYVSSSQTLPALHQQLETAQVEFPKRMFTTQLIYYNIYIILLQTLQK